MTGRQFVPFENLWQMPIDVPYSLLVRDGDDAWSCGQLALDAASNVLAPHDLPAQSRIVADYIAEVLDRGGLDATHLKRLLLYYVSADTGTDEQQVEDMRSAFRAVVSDDVLLDAVAVPHFYYDGIVLEVDAFAGPASDDRLEWISIEAPAANLPASLDQIATDGILSAHWFVPAVDLTNVATDLAQRGLVHDAGAVVSAGGTAAPVRGSLLRVTDQPITDRSMVVQDTRVTSKRSHAGGWISARCTDMALGLVEQTEQIMEAIAATLADEGLNFDAVVKSTTLYTGARSAEDLHDNMAVRNRRYQSPGPASTGLPVFGFADPASRLTVDVTYLGGSSI